LLDIRSRAGNWGFPLGTFSMVFVKRFSSFSRTTKAFLSRGSFFPLSVTTESDLCIVVSHMRRTQPIFVTHHAQPES
jgi:hypothetical protein